MAGHAQRHGTILPDGEYDPVFLFRDGSQDQRLEVGSRVQFTGTAFGALENLVRIEFFADGIKIGDSEEPEFAFSWIADQTGVSGIYAVATDRYGNQVVSSVSTVDVTAPASQGQVVRGPAISEDLSGTYLGTVSGSSFSNGWVAVSVLPSGRASILGYFGSAGYGFFDRDGVVDSNGNVTFPAIRYLYSDPLGDDRPTPGRALHGLLKNGVFDAVFLDNQTKVLAQVSAGGGDANSTAGLYELGVLNQQEGRVLFVANSRGDVRGLVAHGGELISVSTRMANA